MINNTRKDGKKMIDLKNFDKQIESFDEYEALDVIEKLKRKMKKYAQNFQFEEAALLRDQIIKLNGHINK